MRRVLRLRQKTRLVGDEMKLVSSTTRLEPRALLGLASANHQKVLDRPAVTFGLTQF